MARKKVICSKNQIFETSFNLVNNEGETALSARRLAKELAISAMTLYNYVENIDMIKKEVIIRGFNILYKEIYNKLNDVKNENGKMLVKLYCQIIANVLYVFSIEYKEIYLLIFSFKNNRFRKDAELNPLYRFFTQLYYSLRVEKKKLLTLYDSFYMFELVTHGLIQQNINGIDVMTIEDFNNYIDLYISKMI